METAIETGYEGNCYFGSETQKFLNQFYINSLNHPMVTKREKEVLLLLAKGYNSAEIGEKHSFPCKLLVFT